MADIATLRTYLRDHIGLGMDAAGTARAKAVIQEGIESIDDLVDLNYDAFIIVKVNEIIYGSNTFLNDCLGSGYTSGVHS